LGRLIDAATNSGRYPAVITKRPHPSPIPVSAPAPKRNHVSWKWPPSLCSPLELPPART
jgi:hypothetical protein